MNDLTTMNAGGSALAIANTQKAIAEVQAAMVLARQFPRNEVKAIDRIKSAFSRQKLAQASTYIYTRGGQNVTGASIRAAEAIAQAWGNVQFGFREIERGVDKGVGYSEVEAYAWDIESNTKRALQFRVNHIRNTRQGTKPLTDERDIYEAVASQAQRRVRACIIAVIPGDVFDEALEVARQTVEANFAITPDYLKKLLAALEKYGVSKHQVERKFGRSFEALQPGNIIQIVNIMQSIKDGMGTPIDYFPAVDEEEKPASKAQSKTEELKQRIRKTAPQPEPTVAKNETVDQATGEVTFTAPQVEAMIHSSKNMDELSLAMDAIRSVPQDKQEALWKIAQKREGELQ